MKTVVVGGGVVGVTTAYYLAKDGHEVTLIEKEGEVATLASAGNAGMIAPGHSFAWASPAAPMDLFRSLTTEDTALRINPLKAPGMARWGLAFLRNCTADRALRNTLVKLRLAQYSQRLLDELSESERIDYYEVTNGPHPYAGYGRHGMLFVYREEEKLQAGIKKMKLLQDRGQEQQVLDRDGVAEVEPALAPVKHKIAGAIFGLADSSGDSVKLSRELMQRCQAMGVKFQFGSGVKKLVAEGSRIREAVTDKGSVEGDAFVLAAGVQSPDISKTVGIRLPIAPAKGYSATFPIKDGGKLAPKYGGVDEALLVAWNRMGDTLRMTASAEFTGYQTTWKEYDFRGIMRMGRELFPEAAHYDQGSFRACNRPMTPDGPPILGTAKHSNLYFNTGHGHMGFTMACGSSRMVADLISGKKPELPLDGMTLYSRP